MTESEKMTTPKVLIVEDDPTSVFINECLLNHYRVTAVTSGYQALDKLKTERFDVVLMDINLGDIHMDGIRTMREIRKMSMHRSLRIIAITSFASNRQWYLDQGFDEFFLKPLDPEVMIEAVGASPAPMRRRRSSVQL